MRGGNQHRDLPWPDRFWFDTERLPNGCLNFTGYIDRDGYGRVYDRLSGTRMSAHRLAYELTVGPIPDGLHLDHLCRTRSCVEPSHLEPVTAAENQRRGLKGVLLTSCPDGHPYDEQNTRWTGNRRHCRACNLAAVNRYNERLRLAASDR